MSFEVKKRTGESSQGLLRRFSKRIRQSGVLLRARKIRYRRKSLSYGAKKKKALRKEELREKYEKLEKLGKIKE